MKLSEANNVERRDDRLNRELRMAKKKSEKLGRLNALSVRPRINFAVESCHSAARARSAPARNPPLLGIYSSLKWVEKLIVGARNRVREATIIQRTAP